jgi:hypothetical protein
VRWLLGKYKVKLTEMLLHTHQMPKWKAENRK